MSFCCAAESQFGPKVAEHDLRRYRRRGADAVTKLMLAQLRLWPLENKQLLNIGGGIGVISAELAADGIAGATLVEASPAYLEVARGVLQSRYGSRSTKFLLGDFARIANTLPSADVITLDRVVCCYPDAETLLRGAAARTRQLLAFSYPRDRWYLRDHRISELLATDEREWFSGLCSLAAANVCRFGACWLGLRSNAGNIGVCGRSLSPNGRYSRHS